VRRLSAGYGDSVVLRDIDLDVPRTGVLGLMGPSGAGKTTLLRTLGRWNHAVPSAWATGSITCDEHEILAHGSPAAAHTRLPLLGQKARLYGATVIDNLIVDVPDRDAMEPWQRRAMAQAILAPVGLWEEFGQVLDAPVLSLSMAAHKRLLIARLLRGAPPALLADEPLTDVAVADEPRLLEFLRQTGRSRALLVVLHNKQQAQRLCDWICLLTGHHVVEVTPTAQFFTAPRTVLGRQFLESGSCWPTDADDEDTQRLPAAPLPQRSRGQAIALAARARVPPREFHWVIKGRLAGMQRPGLLGDVDDELARLAALGIAVLVSLTETAFHRDKLAEFGIEAVHFPVPDMGVPSLADATDLCRRISAWIDGRRPTALHCRAGLGRTGTLLAATLVYRGLDAVRSIERVRVVNPRYIQSDEQLEFVHRFAEALRSAND
jgi:atypical dual specificity phosphatase